MRKYAQLFVLFFMFVFCSSTKGQDNPDLMKHSTESGTEGVISSTGPKRLVRTIKQDRKGNIWIAAHDGIFRYDGKWFTNVTNNISAVRFFSVLEDRKGNFWFSSPDSGVYFYNGKSTQKIVSEKWLVNYQVPCIYEDKTGNIWFGTPGGASRFDGTSFRNYQMNEPLPELSEDDDNVVYSIIEDKTGKFWFGTKGKAFIYDGKTFTALTCNGKPFRNVRTIIEDKHGNIWFGGNSGLWRYNGSTFTNLSENSVGYIVKDEKGNIWTSSQNANGRWAFSRYDENSLSRKKPTITEIVSDDGDKGIFGMLVAADGSIWFGTTDGVYRYDGKTIKGFKEGRD